MTRQPLVSTLAILVLGALGIACKSGGVGDPCIPNLEYSANEPGAVETGAQIEDRSFQCETRVCLINHFRGRVSCPFGNTKGNPAINEDCYVPGTNVVVSAKVEPQCLDRKDNVYCSCRCAGEDTAAKYCECPAGFVCDSVTSTFDPAIMRPGDKYCVREGNNYTQDSLACQDKPCDGVNEKCGYTENKQKF